MSTFICIVSCLIWITSSYDHSNPNECQCKYECVDIDHDMSIIIDCLNICGFVVIPNVYNITTLTRIYDKFFHELSKRERNRYKETKQHIRGKRIEYVMPHFTDIDRFDNIIYNPLIAESIVTFMKLENVEDIVLDTVTFIEAPGDDEGGDIDQEFHRDARSGLKLQIPLINI
eukprot:830794_1